MKITFILPSIGVGGGVRVVLEYANHLIKNGHKVSVIYPSILTSQLFIRLKPEWYFIKKIAYKMIKPLKLFSKPRHVEINWFNLKAQLIEVPTLDEKYIPDADIIIATWWETAFYVNSYNEKKGKKFYLIQHYETWGGPKNLIHDTYTLNLHKIVIAKWLKKKLIDLGVPDSEIKYIPNGINFEKFKLTDYIKNRPNQVAMIFSHVTFKGSSDGIKALEIAKKEFNGLDAVLFGVSTRPHYLPKWIKYVHDPTQEELVEKIYNGSGIYMCSSLAEGWHLPPAEAMACGCAVVSTDIDGVKDYAIHGKTALLSPAENPELLSKNLLMLLKNEDIRLKIAYAGHDNIKDFNWEKATSRLENAFIT